MTNGLHKAKADKKKPASKKPAKTKRPLGRTRLVPKSLEARSG